MITGSLPPASIYGTWSENIEIWSVDDDTLMDLSGVTEIVLRLFGTKRGGPAAGFAEMTLSMTHGDITIPSQGIVQWRAEVGQMGTLYPGLYEVVLTLEDSTDVLPLILGSISIME